MVKIYYNTLSDYNNQNKFNDLVEGNNNAEYNAFLSSSSVDLYYKVNDSGIAISYDSTTNTQTITTI